MLVTVGPDRRPPSRRVEQGLADGEEARPPLGGRRIEDKSRPVVSVAVARSAKLHIHRRRDHVEHAVRPVPHFGREECPPSTVSSNGRVASNCTATPCGANTRHPSPAQMAPKPSPPSGQGADMNARSGESSLNASPQVIREAPNAAGRTQIPDRFAGAPRVAIAVDGAVAVTNCRPGIEEEVNIRDSPTRASAASRPPTTGSPGRVRNRRNGCTDSSEYAAPASNSSFGDATDGIPTCRGVENRMLPQRSALAASVRCVPARQGTEPGSL